MLVYGAGLKELLEIVCCRYQEPLGSNFIVSTETELTKAQDMFDVADGQFDDALSPGVSAPTFLG